MGPRTVGSSVPGTIILRIDMPEESEDYEFGRPGVNTHDHPKECGDRDHHTCSTDDRGSIEATCCMGSNISPPMCDEAPDCHPVENVIKGLGFKSHEETLFMPKSTPTSSGCTSNV